MLPEHLATTLQSAQLLVPSGSIPLYAQLFITECGLGYSSPIAPTGYRFQEFSWPESLLAVTDKFPSTYDSEPAFLRPFGEFPFFRVPFGWARLHFRSLFAFSSSGLAVVSESLQVGLVSDHYCGYLDNVVTDHETVYELALWHPIAGA
jgi:hypothetical protein